MLEFPSGARLRYDGPYRYVVAIASPSAACRVQATDNPGQADAAFRRWFEIIRIFETIALFDTVTGEVFAR